MRKGANVANEADPISQDGRWQEAIDLLLTMQLAEVHPDVMSTLL